MKYFFADVMPNGVVRASFEYETPEVGPPVDGVPDPQLEAQTEGTLVLLDAPIDWSGPTPTSVLHMVDGALTWVETASLDELKAAKNVAINQWRAGATYTSFPYAGKQIACDTLSRSDIDGVASHISLFGAFPDGFPMAWKTVDNTYVPMPDIDTFKAMYAAMTAQGVANFDCSQGLKTNLAKAASPEEVEAIKWP